MGKVFRVAESGRQADIGKHETEVEIRVVLEVLQPTFDEAGNNGVWYNSD